VRLRQWSDPNDKPNLGQPSC